MSAPLLLKTSDLSMLSYSHIHISYFVIIVSNQAATDTYNNTDQSGYLWLLVSQSYSLLPFIAVVNTLDWFFCISSTTSVSNHYFPLPLPPFPPIWVLVQSGLREEMVPSEYSGLRCRNRECSVLSLLPLSSLNPPFFSSSCQLFLAQSSSLYV